MVTIVLGTILGITVIGRVATMAGMAAPTLVIAERQGTVAKLVIMKIADTVATTVVTLATAAKPPTVVTVEQALNTAAADTTAADMVKSSYHTGRSHH